MCGLAIPGVDILQSGEDLTGENHAARREIRGLKIIAIVSLILTTIKQIYAVKNSYCRSDKTVFLQDVRESI